MQCQRSSGGPIPNDVSAYPAIGARTIAVPSYWGLATTRAVTSRSFVVSRVCSELGHLSPIVLATEVLLENIHCARLRARTGSALTNREYIIDPAACRDACSGSTDHQGVCLAVKGDGRAEPIPICEIRGLKSDALPPIFAASDCERRGVPACPRMWTGVGRVACQPVGSCICTVGAKSRRQNAV